MKHITPRILVTFGAVLLTFAFVSATPRIVAGQAGPGFGQGRGQGQGQARGMRAERGPGAEDCFLARLNLSAEQQARIDVLREQHQAQVTALQDLRRAAMAELQDLVASGTATIAQAADVEEQAHDVSRALRAERRNYRAAVLEVLTQEQAEQLSPAWRLGLGRRSGGGPCLLGQERGTGPGRGMGPRDGTGPGNGMGPGRGMGPGDGTGPGGGTGPRDGTGAGRGMGRVR